MTSGAEPRCAGVRWGYRERRRRAVLAAATLAAVVQSRVAWASAEAAHQAGVALEAEMTGERLVLRDALRGGPANSPSLRRGEGTGDGTGSARPSPVPPARAGAPRAEPGTPGTTSFERVWAFISREPLKAPYPSAKVSFWKLATSFLDDARRTLSEHSDLRADYPKLIRPNGVALAGSWEITEPTPYTGLFAQGARTPVIARASVFSDDTHRGKPRSFGLALKLFPPAGGASQRSANVFLIDDNGGTRTAHFTDAALTTHPRFTFHAGVLLRAPVLAVVSLAQRLADRSPQYRQLYPAAEAGLSAEELASAKSPERLLLRGAEGMPRSDAEDFREELEPARYPRGLRFDVFAADGPDEPWRRIGRVRFDESVVSRAADRSLHFPHPRYRSSDTAERDFAPR